MRRIPHHFKNRKLRTRRNRTARPNLLDPNPTVLRRARGSAICQQMNLILSRHQIVRRLVHTDVCLNPAKQNLPSLERLERRVKPIRAASTERGLRQRLHRFRQQSTFDLRNGRPQLRRCLLAHKNRHAQQLRRFQHNRRASDDAIKLKNRRTKRLLQIDDHQRRVVSVEQMGMSRSLNARQPEPQFLFLRYESSPGNYRSGRNCPRKKTRA